MAESPHGNQEDLTIIPDLETPFQLTNAYVDALYTNFVPEFKEIVDYIFFSGECLTLCQTAPIPPPDALIQNVALPNAAYPSDHVSLAADFIWKVRD